MKKLLPWCAVVAALVLSGSVGRAQQRDHVEIPRDQWQRVGDILTELGARPGAHVADVGAGHGYFTTRMSKAVGETGRVYAVDVNPVSLRELKDALSEEYPNVEIIRGDEDNPRLPRNRLDGVLIVNAYHEFAEFKTMLERIYSALKPGGRLVLVEPIPRAEDATRSVQVKRHTLALDLAEAELKDAGFEIVKRDPAFVTRPGHGPEGERATEPRPTDWLLVGTRR